MTERKHITMQLWEKAGSFDKIASPGDTVDEEIVELFMNCIPPLYYQSDYRQCGEPVKHCRLPENDSLYAPTYMTFKRIDGVWVFVGDCFRGKSEHQTDTPYVV